MQVSRSEVGSSSTQVFDGTSLPRVAHMIISTHLSEVEKYSRSPGQRFQTLSVIDPEATKIILPKTRAVSHCSAGQKEIKAVAAMNGPRFGEIW